MSVSARLLLAALVMSVATLPPILPGETPSSSQQKTICCAHMEMDSCHGCPVNNGTSSSASASTCCATPSTCLHLYISSGPSLRNAIQMCGAIGLTNQRITERSERPPVPPPRSAFS